MSLKAWALTTSARVAAFAGLTLTAAQTTVMEALIDSVTDFIEGYLGCRVMKTTHTNEEYDTNDADSLNLKNFPLIAGSTVVLARRMNVLNEDDWETVDTEYYHIDYATGVLYGAGGWRFVRTRRGYRVTYTAGYDYDNAATFLSGTTGGGDIEMAAWMLLEGVWNKRLGGTGVQSERLGDYSVTYAKLLMENEDIQALLDRHAKVNEATVITPLQE